MLGTILRQREQQYQAVRDEKGTWRILDTWHNSLDALDPTDDIPDTSPAVTVLSEGAFLALVKAAAQAGLIQHALDSTIQAGVSDGEYQRVCVENDNLRQECDKIRAELNTAKSSPPPLTEPYVLKKHIVDSMLKIAALADLSEVKSVSS